MRIEHDEYLDADERAALDRACSAAHDAFRPAFEQWKRRVDAGEVAADVDAWPISVAVPDSAVTQGKCESHRADFAQAGKQAALSTQRHGRDAYLDLSDDADELFGREMYFWYVKFRDPTRG